MVVMCMGNFIFNFFIYCVINLFYRKYFINFFCLWWLGYDVVDVILDDKWVYMMCNSNMVLGYI